MSVISDTAGRHKVGHHGAERCSAVRERAGRGKAMQLEVAMGEAARRKVMGRWAEWLGRGQSARKYFCKP